MTSTEGASERAEPPCIRPEPPVDAHSPGKATASGGCAVITDGGSKVTANGVHDLENRILRITGYYGYNRGYSSHKREDGSESNAETPGSETSDESRSYQTCTNTAVKVLGGLLLVLCVSSSWVGTTQVVKLTFQSFSCPFFISWFSSNWNIFFFPIYYSGLVVTTREKQTPIQKFRECSRLFGEDGMTLKLFVKRTAPFSILWTLTNYLYLMALKKLTATDVSALYCCHKAFVFLLSWIVLKDRFMGVRVRMKKTQRGLMSCKGLFVSHLQSINATDGSESPSADCGGHHGHHRYRDDGVRGRFPWGLLCGRGIGCGVRQHISSLQGAVQDVPGQCQHRRSGSLPFHHGLLQSHLHLLCAPHPLLHQSGALGLPVLATLGVPVWTGRTVAGVQHLGPRWRGADVPHSHLHRHTAQRPGKCSCGRFETRGDLQCRAPGGHLHHLPGLPAPAAPGGVGLGHPALPGLHRRQEARGARRGADGVQRQHSEPQPGQRHRLHSPGVSPAELWQRS
uniref:Solute carrier family 35 member F4 n=1 Tax=Gasterosteus aculeatus aculeatus TaxID=481459 RepID=A0AAQ4QFJ6_GASAC